MCALTQGSVRRLCSVDVHVCGLVDGGGQLITGAKAPWGGWRWGAGCVREQETEGNSCLKLGLHDSVTESEEIHGQRNVH